MEGASDNKKMGLFGATMLVAVNMMGTGIFLLPTSMASIGGLSIWGWLVASIGAGAIGLIFAMLGAADPVTGGPYGYARKTFGKYTGFQTNYVYWTGNLVGNVAVVATLTGYFAVFFPVLKQPENIVIFNIFLVWIVTFINIMGPKLVGYVTGWGTVIGMIPVVTVAIFGWIWFSGDTYMQGWNPGGMEVFDGISKSAAFALWAYMGVETASVASDSIDNPKRNIPLATMLGFTISMVLYVSTCVVIMGIVPNQELQNSADPFVLVVSKMFGNDLSKIVALCAIMKVGSSLIGWTLVIAKSSQAAAQDGMFPKIYGRVNVTGIPIYNFIFSAALMSLIVLITAAPTIQKQFNEIIDMAVILTLLAYMYTSITYIEKFARKSQKLKTVGVYFVGIIACVYCLWAVKGSADNLTSLAMIFILSSIPLYAFFYRHNKLDTPNAPGNPPVA